jgi:signal transduction histidine kinase
MKMFLRGILLITVVTLIPIGGASGQSARVDSLEKALRIGMKKHEPDSVMRSIARRLYLEFKRSDFVKAKEYARLALKYSEHINDYSKLISSLGDLGGLLDLLGEWNEAEVHLKRAESIAVEKKDQRAQVFLNSLMAMMYLHKSDATNGMVHAQKALALAEAGKDSVNIARLSVTAGIIYDRINRPDEGLDYLLKAARIFELTGDYSGFGMCRFNIANILRKKGQTRQALEYYWNAIDLKTRVKEFQAIGMYYDGIGLVYLDMNQPDSANFYFEKGRAMKERVGDIRGFPDSYRYLATCANLLGKHADALSYQRRSYDYYRSLEDRSGEANMMAAISESYGLLGRQDSSLVYAKMAVAIADDGGVLEDRSRAHYVLAQAFHKGGMEKDAFEQIRLYSSLNDSLSSVATSKKIAELTTVFDLERKQRQIAILEKDKQIKDIELLNRQALLRQNEAEIDNLHNQQIVRQLELEHQQDVIENLKLKEIDHDQKIKLLDHETALNKSELERTENLRNSLLVGSILLLIIVLSLIWRIRERKRAQERYRIKSENLEAANEVIRRHESELLEQAEIIQKSNALLNGKNIDLQRLDEERRQLMAVAAHDLRNPLGVIKGSAGILREDELSKEDATICLSLIQTTSDKMLTILNNMLSVDQIESGRIKFNLESISISQFIRDLVANHQLAAASKKQIIDIHVAEDSEVMVDRTACTEIFENLLSNAMKYSYVGGSIVVVVDRDNCEAVIKVKDAGPGIKKEEMDKLFKKFSRLSTRPTGDEPSTGLGLSIAKMLIEAMHGRIWCESDAAQGATFSVALPIAPHN